MKKKDLIKLLDIGDDDSEVYWHSEGMYGTIHDVLLQDKTVSSKDKSSFIIIDIDSD